jgi:hypothetical protein
VKAKRSTVYKYFTFVDGERKLKCNICDAVLTYCSTTSNLRSHVKYVHRIALSPTQTKTITNYTTKLDNNQAINILVDYVIEDLLPFNLVEGLGFKKMVTRLYPSFPKAAFNGEEVCHRAFILFETRQAKWKEILHGVKNPSFTFDLWSGLNGTCFVGVTAHWITQCWQLQTLAVDLIEFTSTHTATNIATSLRQMYRQWGVDNAFATVRDRGSNVVAATALLSDLTEWDLDCYCHGIQRDIINALDATKEFRQKLKPFIQ